MQRLSIFAFFICILFSQNQQEVKIISVGDIFIHKSILNSVYDAKEKYHDFYPIFEKVKPYLHSVDLTTAWFGGALDTVGPYTGYPCFKTPGELAYALKDAGFDVLFRTNHTLDYGFKGLKTTAKILKDTGLVQIGAYVTEEESEQIYLFEKRGIRIAFLSYTYGTNGIPIPEPWMVKLIDIELIKKDIEKARPLCDFIIVALHLGMEYERYPNKQQKRIARKIAEIGADMIIGSHPHVLQPAEIIEVENRKIFVAYSLGNFFCGQRKKYTDTGIMLKYIIAKDNNHTYLKEVRYIPTYVAKYKTGDAYEFKILPIEKSIKLYLQDSLGYIGEKNYKRMISALKETVEHIENPGIDFVREE
ncbi:MAG: CapA family protein [candidate division WOR-3 bacterium]|nr:CapA family protein [candidate division WOR-3 bacterium]